MTNLSRTHDEPGRAFAQKDHDKMDHWRSGLHKLEQSLNELSAEMRAEYREQLASLKLHWQQVESKYAAMKRATVEEHEAAYTQWRDTAVAYNDAFVHAINNMKEHAPLGWAQGFTNERTKDSIGWAEGYAAEGPKDSEGFAEGMGHKGEATSEGWAEGYDKVSQS